VRGVFGFVFPTIAAEKGLCVSCMMYIGNDYRFRIYDRPNILEYSGIIFSSLPRPLTRHTWCRRHGSLQYHKPPGSGHLTRLQRALQHQRAGCRSLTGQMKEEILILACPDAILAFVKVRFRLHNSISCLVRTIHPLQPLKTT
jgi:hypothetical protein